jgi:hypothetical protein
LLVIVLFVIGIVLPLCYLIDYWNSKHLVGRLDIDGVNVYVNIYKEGYFDPAGYLFTYEIAQNGLPVAPDAWMAYTDDEIKIEDFKTGICDSIIYITFRAPGNVHAVHDLRTGQGFPHGQGNLDYSAHSKIGDAILDRLKVCDTSLFSTQFGR